MSIKSTYWKSVAAAAVIVAALVSGFMERAVPWPRALLYGGGAAVLVLCFGWLVDDFFWWGARLWRAIRDMPANSEKQHRR